MSCSVRDLAIIFSIDKETVRRWIRNGELKATKYPNGYRIEREDLKNFLNEHPKYMEIWKSSKFYEEDRLEGAETVIYDRMGWAHPGYYCNCPGCPYNVSDCEGNDACYDNMYRRCHSDDE